MNSFRLVEEVLQVSGVGLTNDEVYMNTRFVQLIVLSD